MSQQFDHTVDVYNKQGKVVSHNPYRRVCNGQGVSYERPPYSGKWYNADGSVLRDESEAIDKQKAAEFEAKHAADEAKRLAAHEALVAEIRAEEREKLMAEMTAAKKGHNGTGSKA